jgi:aminoglycoside adenylyltransferase-like protein
VARIPADVSNLLDQLSTSLPLVVGGNLVGIYLYGSLTQQAFNRRRSDIDCIAVVKHDLSDAQFRRLRKWLAEASKSNPWVMRLQMSVLIRDEILVKNSRYCLYQFGKLKRGRSDGNPIIWINVLESGVTLHGPNPTAFVPPIAREIFFDALMREAGYIREELIEKPNSKWRDVQFYRAYAAMTLCRILYSQANGTVVSKPLAVRWAMKNLETKWHALIRQAMKSGGPDERPSSLISLRELRQFVRFTEATLRAES